MGEFVDGDIFAIAVYLLKWYFDWWRILLSATTQIARYTLYLPVLVICR